MVHETIQSAHGRGPRIEDSSKTGQAMKGLEGPKDFSFQPRIPRILGILVSEYRSNPDSRLPQGRQEVAEAAPHHSQEPTVATAARRSQVDSRQAGWSQGSLSQGGLSRGGLSRGGFQAEGLVDHC